MRRDVFSRILFLLLIVSNPEARGDGCFVWRAGADLNEPSQKALICFREATETMILQVKYEGPAEDFAWIVPLPSRPDVDAVEQNKSPFAELSLYTQRRARWGYRGFTDEQAKGLDVELLERKVVGVYDVAVLKASESVALTEWLKKNGFALPARAKEILKHYVKKKWVYVAMRIDGEALTTETSAKLKTGSLQPVRFRFQTREAVYPLKISSMNAGKTEVLLYVLADVPLQTRDTQGKAGLGIEMNIPKFMQLGDRYQDPTYATYAKVSQEELPLTWETIGLDKQTRLFLCKYRALYPTEEMTDDLAFAPFDPEEYFTRRLEREADLGFKLRLAAFLMGHDKAKYGKIRREILVRMSESARLPWRASAARHANTPVEALGNLARSSQTEVREALAQNPSTPPDILRQISTKDDKLVRYHLARHPSTPSDVLKELARDDDSATAHAALHHKNLSARHLAELAHEKSERILLAVANNSNCNPETLRMLLQHENRDIRVAAATNPALPMKDLAKLVESPDDYLRSCVAPSSRATEDMLVILAQDRYDGARAGVARNSKTPTALLVSLADDRDEYVRKYVACNARTPPKLLEKLADDRYECVRYELAGNLGLPQNIALKLAYDKSWRVRYHLAEREGLPTEVRKVLAGDEQGHVRLAIAENKTTTRDILTRLAKDKDSKVRQAVAYNANTPTEVLEQLAREQLYDVSSAAKHTLRQGQPEQNK